MAEVDLAGWLARLEALHPSEIDMGLERVVRVARALGISKPAPLVFTVTGTNGKGSTCAALEQLLSAAGLRTGLYSSPHLLRYNERVRINGLEASDVQLCSAFAQIEAARGDTSLTYFEFGTLAALLLFVQSDLDAVVLEVGLGGRLDAVNIIDADIAVVTSIGLDHQAFLGNTRESVGYEKAGIMRSGRPVVLSETDIPTSFNAEMQRLGVKPVVRKRDYGWQFCDQQGGWHAFVRQASGETLETGPLPAVTLPRDNLVSALQAFCLAGLSLDHDQIVAALAQVQVAGRLQSVEVVWQGRKRHLLLDVGHNPHAARYLADTLQQRPMRRQAVFGLLADKDLDGVIAPFAGLFQGWSVAPLPNSRSLAADQLKQALQSRNEPVTAYPSIAAAIEQALSAEPAAEEIVIFGSFFCVAEAILWITHLRGI
ncbi:MAG: bifunctional tetrahydrofolate synthase/dihydrofolate synthase [Gammaproteobacteria bacterium HGW-Gammaproteobacteria-6]|nr:MAG: bifunctional tetrahydrofolate synthase/dihydrofolate synthase [Gammaproteobacteria bacterium HGW-Gammaproteobacteria-6]